MSLHLPSKAPTRKGLSITEGTLNGRLVRMTRARQWEILRFIVAKVQGGVIAPSRRAGLQKWYAFDLTTNRINNFPSLWLDRSFYF